MEALQPRALSPRYYIDSLGYVMETLELIRKEQAEIDMKFNPV